jgi:hypothetical protein
MKKILTKILRCLRHASVVQNSRVSVTYDLSIAHWGHDSETFPRFGIDLNCGPIPALTRRLILREKLDGLPPGDHCFNQVFIKLAFGQQFHVKLWS